MNAAYKAYISKHKTEFLRKMDTGSVIDKMKAFDRLTDEEVTSIKRQPLYNQAAIFLDLLPQKSDLDFIVFHRCLELTGQEELAEMVTPGCK